MQQQPNRTSNRASFNLGPGQSEAEQEIRLDGRDVGWIHGAAKIADPANPPEFDVVVQDAAGVEQKRMHFKMIEAERFGVQTDLPMADDRYKIRIENAKGVTDVDLFLE